MRFKLEIDTRGDAFFDPMAGEEGYYPEPEIARILRDIADNLDNGDILDVEPDLHPLKDTNGNTVGKFGIVEWE